MGFSFSVSICQSTLTRTSTPPKPCRRAGLKLAEARARAVATNKALADAYAVNVLPIIRAIRNAGGQIARGRRPAHCPPRGVVDPTRVSEPLRLGVATWRRLAVAASSQRETIATTRAGGVALNLPRLVHCRRGGDTACHFSHRLLCCLSLNGLGS